jgi:hypothetical protein
MQIPRFMRACSFVLVFLMFSGTVSAQNWNYSWPLPEKWVREIIPFPIKFAPELAYEGVEEVHFMPGWRKNDTLPQQFWSYTFVWYIDSVFTFSAVLLEKDLSNYFNGLQKWVMANAGMHLNLKASSVISVYCPDPENPGEFRGTSEILDVFFTMKRITLNMKISQPPKQPAHKTILFFELSPQPYENPVWKELDRNISEFGFK